MAEGAMNKAVEAAHRVTKEGMAAIQALIWYEYNVPHTDIIREIYGEDHHELYLEEKLNLLSKRGINYLYGQLDEYHRNRFVVAMYARYRRDAAKSAGIEDDGT